MTEKLSRLRVVVVDDHPVFVEGLVGALEDRGVDVVAALGDAEDAAHAVATHEPDVVLMDLALPGMSGVEATRAITAEHPDTPVVVLTMSNDDESVFAALRAGARGYLLKQALADDIVRAVHAAARGDAVLGKEVSGQVLGAVTGASRWRGPRPLPQLTDREREVADLVARGHDNAQIARRLGLADKTVRNHVSNVLVKLHVTSRAEAIVVVRDAGLGQGP